MQYEKKKLEGHFEQWSKLYLSLNAQREIQILNGIQQIFHIWMLCVLLINLNIQ